MDSLTAFNAICPAYATDPNVPVFLSIATSRTSQNLFGENLGLAIALRAAHMMTLSKRIDGAPGPVQEKREGDLSIRYGMIKNPMDRDLLLTHYGMQLLGLIYDNIVPFGVTGGNDVGRNDTPYPQIPRSFEAVPDTIESSFDDG